MVLNRWLTFWPRKLIAAIHKIAMRATTREYSTSVAPSSSPNKA